LTRALERHQPASSWLDNLKLDTYMQIAGTLLVLPAILLLSVLVIGPFLYVIYYSFVEKGVSGLSFANYLWLLGPRFWPTFLTSTIIGFGSVVLEILAAVPLALLLNQRLVGRGIFRALVTLPWAVPTISAAAGFLWLANTNYGIFNQIGLHFHLLSEPIAFVGDPAWALPTVVFAHAWKGLPLVFIILFASLQSLAPEQLEAARVDGAWHLAQLRHIILPHLKPAIGLAAALSGIYNFALFDLTFLLTGGGPSGRTTTLPILEYTQMFRSLDTGRAATLGVTIFLVGVLTMTALSILNRQERARQGRR
jgi:ABC-type sugar transport system permease subunit